MRAPFLSVYTASIPSHVSVGGVFPFSRENEILSCSSEKAKQEKYCAWKLLEYALLHAFGKRIDELSFEKTESGKWVCDFCHFSLSHSHGAVAVALSDSPVGVDIEKLAPIKNRESVAKKILTETEKEDYRRLALNAPSTNEYLLEIWTKKESVYKMGAHAKFLPNRIETGKEQVFTRKIFVGGTEYLLSVANENARQAKFNENSPFTL